MKILKHFVVGFVIVLALLLLTNIVGAQFRGRLVAHTNACANNLRMIDSSKELWAKASNATNGQHVAAADIVNYMKNNTVPHCPSPKGTYTLGAVGETPRCSIHGTTDSPVYPFDELPRIFRRK